MSQRNPGAIIRWPASVASAVAQLRSYIAAATEELSRIATPPGVSGQWHVNLETDLVRMKEVLDAFQETYPITPTAKRSGTQIPLDE